MQHSILIDTDAIYISLILFLSMTLILLVSYRLGEKTNKISTDDAGILGSMLGMFALLLAFSFGMAGTRFENRKNNLIEEANCIGTALLRSDIFPDTSKIAFRHDFEKYLDARILFFKSEKNDTIIYRSFKNSDEAAKKLWKRACFYGKQRPPYLVQSNMMLPALNSMFDIASTNNTLFNSYVPETIIYLLLAFSLILSFYVGFNAGFKKHIDKIFLLGFCLLTSIVIYTILDLDRPRRGVINIRNEMTLLEDLKSNFHISN